MGKVHIGTSGWIYDGWRGPFYPQDMPKKRWLAWYATQFATAEINGSFYRTPSLDAVRGWAGQTPKDFVFAWKASRFVTHWKRLSAKSKNSDALMVTRLEALGPKAGPVLFQLPARFTANRERLTAFLPMLPQPYHYAFEFRDASWYDDTILDLLRRHRVALCISDHHEAPAPWEVTARHVARARPDRRVSRQLSRQDAAPLGPRDRAMEQRAPNRPCLLRQRLEKRSACGCAAAQGDGRGMIRESAH